MNKRVRERRMDADGLELSGLDYSFESLNWEVEFWMLVLDYLLACCMHWLDVRTKSHAQKQGNKRRYQKEEMGSFTLFSQQRSVIL